MPFRRSTRNRKRTSPYQSTKGKNLSKKKRSSRSTVVTILCGSSSGESDIEEISPKDKNILLDTTTELTHHKPANTRAPCELNGDEEISNPSNFDGGVDDYQRNNSEEVFYDSPYDSDALDDIYSIDFKAQKLKVMDEVQKQLKNRNDKKKVRIEEKEVNYVDVDKCTSSLEDYSSSPVPDAISSISSPLIINTDDIQLSNSAKPRVSRKTKHALASLRAFSQTLDVETSINDSVNMDDVLLFDGNCEQKTAYRILWGTKYLKLTMNKNGKFLNIYQQLAEKNNVGVGEVILSFNNKAVSPDSRPSDIGFTVADALEGGILSSLASSKAEDESSGTNVGLSNEDSIELKFQSSDRKGLVTLAVNKFDRFAIIMEKYAQMKTTDCSRLKFHFDGEKIDANETPTFYDLEGGECIDVFESR